jgi:beta-mannosidase
MFNDQLAPYKSNSYAASQKIYHRDAETQRKVKILKTLRLCASVVHSFLVEGNAVKLGTNNEQLEEEALAALIQASQLAQAVGLQVAIEHMRRRRAETSGLCLWQFNEPWPAISWAIVDYFGRPKLAYERLSTWYNPVLVSLNFPPSHRWQPGETFTAELWAINDGLQPYSACRLRVMLDGQAIHIQTIDLPPDSARRLGILSHKLQTPPQTLTLTLHQGDNLLCRNLYPLDWTDLSLPHPSRRFRRWVADWVLR